MTEAIEKLKERIDFTTKNWESFGIANIAANQVIIMQSLIAIMQKLDKIETK